MYFQHQSGLDYLYYADGEAWVVGATFGGPRVGIVNFERKVCPYQVTPGTWRHSVNGKLERDSGIVLKCVDRVAEAGDGEEPVRQFLVLLNKFCFNICADAVVKNGDDSDTDGLVFPPWASRRQIETIVYTHVSRKELRQDTIRPQGLYSEAIQF